MYSLFLNIYYFSSFTEPATEKKALEEKQVMSYVKTNISLGVFLDQFFLNLDYLPFWSCNIITYIDINLIYTTYE